MNNPNRVTFLAKSYLLGLFIVIPFMTNLAHADKPDWAGGGKKDRQEQAGKNEGNRGGNHEKSRDDREHDEYRDTHRDQSSIRINGYFNDHQREIARSYYGEQFRRGNCPPGLAKKHNGCMPPGQAKKWAVGRPLPRDVIFYDVPDSVIIQLGYPPAGHRYVRVAADILMIAVGTGLVVDAIDDLGRM